MMSKNAITILALAVLLSTALLTLGGKPVHASGASLGTVSVSVVPNPATYGALTRVNASAEPGLICTLIVDLRAGANGLSSTYFQEKKTIPASGHTSWTFRPAHVNAAAFKTAVTGFAEVLCDGTGARAGGSGVTGGGRFGLKNPTHPTSQTPIRIYYKLWSTQVLANIEVCSNFYASSLTVEDVQTGVQLGVDIAGACTARSGIPSPADALLLDTTVQQTMLDYGTMMTNLLSAAATFQSLQNSPDSYTLQAAQKSMSASDDAYIKVLADMEKLDVKYGS